MKNTPTEQGKRPLALILLVFACLQGFPQSNPGGVGGAAVWLKADQGVIATGSNITTWVNQAGGANFTGKGNPQVNANSVNFNPAIVFNGSNYLTSNSTILSNNNPYTKFVVFKYDGSTANNLVSSGTGGSHALFGNNTNTDLVIHHAGNILTASNVVSSARYYMGTAGFTSGAPGGTYINVDGSTRANMNSSAAYTAAAMQLGAHGNGNNLTGRIAEVIVYPTALASNATTTRQIQGYLGIKYGITVAHNYLSSAGAPIYDVSSAANNIAGIGRDDNSSLNQKQGQSINTGTSQVVMALGSVAATNAANSNTFSADKQFLLWGDDNGSINTTTALSGWAITTTRLTRVWKLQNTGGFNQQVTVYFPTASLNVLPGSNPYLIYNTSNTLAGGGTEVPSSAVTNIGGISYTGFQVTFPTIGPLYFSFAAKTVNPGNVAGALVWLRPDAGVMATGNNVNTWINQMNAGNSFTGTGNPQLATGNVNFNPGITFSGSNYLTSTGNVLPANSAYTKFVVFKYDGVNTNNIVSSPSGGNHAFFGNNTTTDLILWHSGNILNATGSVNASRYFIGTGGFTRNLTGGTYINVDGAQKGTTTSPSGYVASGIQLGAYSNGSNLTGRIAEVIVYPSSLGNNAAGTRQIESYLGLKYGITIAHDYLASDGATTTYAVSSFANNIAGIGRDDNTALYQKQGRSINTGTSQVVMSLGSVAATNATNTGVIPSDNQFLVWGDDNGSVTTTTGLSGWTTSTTRLSKIWKLENTGGFSQQVSVYFPVTSLNYLPGTNPYLIFNTSNTLAGGGTEVPAGPTVMIDGIAYKSFTVTFPATGILYFSFAAKAVNPGNVAGASVWLRPDAGINASGTNVTSWTNQVSAANSFTGTGNPQLAAGNINFYPGITFSGSNYLTSAGVALPANSNYTKFVVFKYDGATTNNIVSSGGTGNNALFGANTNTNLVIFHNTAIFTALNAVTGSRYYLGAAGFASGVAAGTFINVDGANKGSINSSAGYLASTMQLGAHGDGNNLTGRIAEVIVYPSALGSGTTATRQIESYLGIKYGITLGHDYLASDGTTATYSIASHNNNIAGIGRDDDEGLNQLQGQSINTAATSQVIMAVGSIAASNAANSNTIAGDKQLLVWGDDNASIANTVAVTGFTTVNNRFTRVWKLQNTGNFNQEVTVYFPTTSLHLLTNATKYLIYNTSATLTGPGTEVAANSNTTINGVAYTGFTLTFPATGTLYFSFASKAVNPGGVGGAAAWVRGDAGVSTSGTSVTSWINQMNTGNSFTPTGNPQLTTGAVNFNPTVLFDGSSYLTSAANITTSAAASYTKFVVFRSAGGAGGLNLLSAAAGAPGSAMYTPNQSLKMLHNAVEIATTPAGSINPGKQYLGTQLFSNGTANGTLIRVNGTTSTAITSSTNHNVDKVQIGGYGGSNLLSAGSNIAEAVMYNTALVQGDYRRVESYLALKYGLTLGADYVATDGGTVYAVTGYGNNIAGIGRDDNTGLHQRQSQSVNPGTQVVMATGSAAASNEANTNAVTSDLQFLVWGDNNAPGYNYNMGVNQKRLASTWKLQNTNSFNQSVTVYYPVSGLYGLGNAPQLIYGSLSSMDDGSAARVSAGGTVTINGETYQSFALTFPVTATSYFSFAAQIVPEICDNGIDDDLDGYIDELDAACAPIPGCTAAAPPLTSFAISQKWVTSTTNALAASVSPTIADLDGDGIPEILTVRAGGTGITYFKGNGSNLGKNTIDYNIQLPVRVTQSTMQPAVADVDRDGKPEVVVVGADGYVYVFNNVSGSSTNYKYRSVEVVSTRFANGSPRIVDINEDGIPEIVVGLDVFQFNFSKGLLIKAVTGSATAPCGLDGIGAGNEWGNDIVVIDILASNPGKEIVAGSQVYGVDLATGTTTVLANLSTIAGAGVIPANDDGPTAVADLDFDGNLDIAYPNGTHMIVWDPTAGTLKMKAAYFNNGGMNRGLPAIANVYDEQTLNGKPSNLPEIIFNSGLRMHAFNLNNTAGPVWSMVTTDGSGETGVTAFDLNGDGVLEIIYNDQDNIRVVNGNTAAPANIASFASGTATWMEHPVVVDVDNDGSAEFVCVSAGSSAFTGMLRVFSASNGTSAWQNTRKIWNGRGYRPKSVNDDLSIPVKEQSITLQYPSGSGKYPMDVFNAQIDARLLSPGLIAASDLYISDLKVLKSATACEFTPSAASLVYTVANNGSAAAPAGTPVRFYMGDPRASGAVLLSTTRELAANLVVGASVTDTVTLNVSAFTPPYNIYAVMNDDGSTPAPFTLPIVNSNVKECNYSNNIASIVVRPMPADFGNLLASWPLASASMFVTDAAWLGITAPTAECAPDENDGADGLVMTSGSTSGNGAKAAPWMVKGVGTVCNFTITVNGNGSPKPVYWAAWYDVDANGSFTDPTDLFISGSLTHGSPISTTFSFTIPAAFGATEGAIRVIATAVDPGFTKEMNGTGTFINGEVEDYFVRYAAPLPITLKSFTASPLGNCTARIRWTTAMEENSSHFEIEQSTNGSEFHTIAEVQSSNNPSGNSYLYTDNNATEGKSYYRLKMVDRNGSSQYSHIAVVQGACSNIDIRLLPNPVISTTTISGLGGGEKLMVFGSDGRLEMTETATGNTHTLNMKMLPSGIHLVKIIRNGVPAGQVKVTKL